MTVCNQIANDILHKIGPLSLSELKA